jgi:hypothetical protein
MRTLLSFVFLSCWAPWAGAQLAPDSLDDHSALGGIHEAATEAPVQEILVTPEPIFDFEFDPDADRFSWVVIDTGDLWVGHVDPHTGEFLPPTGKGELVDVNAVMPGNSSEWVAIQPQNRIVYTKREPGDIVRMAQASLDGDGVTWKPSMIEGGEFRVNPCGGSELVDSTSIILYLHLTLPPFIGGMGTGAGDAVDPGFDLINEHLAWRILDDPGSELTVPKSLGATGARWVPGEAQMVFTRQVDDGRQVFFYDGVTHTTQQLTFDGGLKQTVFMWEAPEFPGEKIFFASVKLATQSQVRVYRYLDPEGDGAFAWTAIKTLNGGPGMYFWSPEYFVHNGRSYMFWVASPVPDQPSFQYPSQIWVASADPADAFYKSLSDPTTSRFRLDPELYVTDAGPSIYYNRYLYDPHAYEGVYRVDLGLGPTDEAQE